MSPSIFLLVLASALLHAGWNFATRRIAGNLAAVWLGLWLGSALLFPAVIAIVLAKGLSAALPAEAMICIAATGLIHRIYFQLVSAVYEQGELSIAYPIARGSGVALAAAAAALFLGERYTPRGIVGIALIAAGIVSLSAMAGKKAGSRKNIALALGIGLAIVAYSLVDKIGVRYINPVLYIWFMFLIAAATMTPLVANRYPGGVGWAAKRYAGHSFAIGAGSIGTYLMILFAYTRGPLGYIVAVRELSVVFGALAGIVFLKERCTIFKIAAIGVIVVGNICIRLM